MVPSLSRGARTATPREGDRGLGALSLRGGADARRAGGAVQDLVLYSGSRSEAGAERGDEARRTASILASYPVSGAWRDSIGCA